MKKFKEIVYQTAKAEDLIKSTYPMDLAIKIFGNSHPQLEHLSKKILSASHLGGVLRLMQTLDYDNEKMFLNWIKTL